MARVYNFSAGPAVLPVEVLKEAQEEMLDYRGCGMSVMEMSHRGKIFDGIIKEAEKDLRELMNIPDNYKVLFLQGGAHQQFAAVPMNMTKNGKAAYIITGQWSKRAFQEASRYTDAVAVASSQDKTFSYIPDSVTSIFPKMRITSTSARTIRFTAPSSGSSPTPRGMSLCRTSLPAFCPSPWM